MEILKIAIPSCISFLSAYLFFFLAGRSAKRIETSLQLIQFYHSNEMQEAREKAWDFLTNPAAKQENLVEFCAWITNNVSHGGSNIASFQKVLRVLNYFATVEMCLQHKQVVPDLMVTGLGWSYESWRLAVLDPVRQNLTGMNPGRLYPAWHQRFVRLDETMSKSPVERPPA